MILLTEDDARPDRDAWPRRDGRVIVEHDGQTIACYSPSNLPNYLGAGFSAPAWSARCQAKGAGLRPDLAIMAAPLDVKADAAELDGIVAELELAGGRMAAANRGTAMHSAIRRLLRGLDPEMPDECAADIAAVRAVIDEWGIKLVDDWDERQFLNVDLPTCGQADAIVTSSKLDGHIILDAKTGRFKPLDCAIQLSAYAGSTHEAVLVDGTVELRPLPFDIRTDVGLILHAPWGEGTARIIAVDLIEGRRLAELAIAAHAETLNSGRVVIKELGSLRPAAQVEPTDGAAGEDVAIAAPAAPSLHAHMGDLRRRGGVLVEQNVRPLPHVSLHAHIGDLRRRGGDLVEQQVITADDAKAFMARHDVPPLSKPDEHTADTVDLWEDWITTLEMSLDAGARLPGIVERLEALPVDLYAHVEMRSKEATPPVPHLANGKATGPDLDRLEAILAPVELLHAERVAQVTQALDAANLTIPEERAAIEWACEGRELSLPHLTINEGVRQLDNLEAERVLALCESYRHDDLPAALAALGPARPVIATARQLAERHQIPAPKSGRDIASDRILAGLVLIHHNTESN